MKNIVRIRFLTPNKKISLFKKIINKIDKNKNFNCPKNNK